MNRISTLCCLFAVCATFGSGGRAALAQAGDLYIAGSCPGEVVLLIKGAAPNARYWMLQGNGRGNFAVPGPGACAGTALGILGNVRVAASIRTDGRGIWHSKGGAPAASCGQALQALSKGTCATTNVVDIP